MSLSKLNGRGRCSRCRRYYSSDCCRRPSTTRPRIDSIRLNPHRVHRMRGISLALVATLLYGAIADGVQGKGKLLESNVLPQSISSSGPVDVRLSLEPICAAADMSGDVKTLQYSKRDTSRHNAAKIIETAHIAFRPNGPRAHYAFGAAFDGLRNSLRSRLRSNASPLTEQSRAQRLAFSIQVSTRR